MLIATFKNTNKKYLLTSIIKYNDYMICGRCAGATMYFNRNSFNFEGVWF